MFISTLPNLVDWSKLHLGLCPKCAGVLFNNTYGFMKCSDCAFKIGQGKFADLVKGKGSTAYRKVLKQRKKTRDLYRKQETRLGMAMTAQNEERERNLRRMKAKGLIP